MNGAEIIGLPILEKKYTGCLLSPKKNRNTNKIIQGSLIPININK